MDVINTSEAKTYLDITTNDYDTKIGNIVDSVNSYITNEIWNITQGSKTDQKSIYQIGYYWDLRLDISNVQSVDSINWQSYTWTKWTDYQIVWDRKVIIKDINDYLTDLEFRYFDITYTAWYSSLPNDLKLAAKIIVATEFNKNAGKEVISYTMWPQEVSLTKGSFEDKAIKRYKNKKIYTV